jgi:hypothetical protein
MKESLLAHYIISHFESKNYESYKEVKLNFNKKKSIRCDIYLVDKKDNTTIAIECKTSFSFKVLSQANAWKNHAHKTYIATLEKNKRYKRGEYKLIKEICEGFLNIGLLVVNSNGDVKEIISSESIKDPKIPSLLEEQKHSIASNDINEYFTPFKGTVNRILSFLSNREDATPLKLKDVITYITHHYKNDTIAYNSLNKWIKKGLIKDVYINENNEIYLKTPLSSHL